MPDPRGSEIFLSPRIEPRRRATTGLQYCGRIPPRLTSLSSCASRYRLNARQIVNRSAPSGVTKAGLEHHRSQGGSRGSAEKRCPAARRAPARNRVERGAAEGRWPRSETELRGMKRSIPAARGRSRPNGRFGPAARSTQGRAKHAVNRKRDWSTACKTIKMRAAWSPPRALQVEHHGPVPKLRLCRLATPAGSGIEST